MPARAALHIAGNIIVPGSEARVEIPTAQLYTSAPIDMPMHVFHGKKDGPTLLVCAAIHGDELNGIEIVRQVINRPELKKITGTLIAVPIVNQLGFIHQSRYLPDRRDLNRCFPGTDYGSLGSRMAHQFKTHVVDMATHIIDLHTAAVNRTNLPQIRTDVNVPENLAMAQAFGMPVVLNTEITEGTLRQMAGQEGKFTITYEGGEALRFNDDAIKVGVNGVLNVMSYLGMLPDLAPPPQLTPTIANSSLWIRAEADGMLDNQIELGAHVKEQQLLGYVNDPFGTLRVPVTSPVNGIVIATATNPLVHQGEALYHIASFRRTSSVARKIEELQSMLNDS